METSCQLSDNLCLPAYHAHHISEKVYSSEKTPSLLEGQLAVKILEIIPGFLRRHKKCIALLRHTPLELTKFITSNTPSLFCALLCRPNVVHKIFFEQLGYFTVQVM